MIQDFASLRGVALGDSAFMSEEIEYVYLERPDAPLLVELTQRAGSGGDLAME